MIKNSSGETKSTWRGHVAANFYFLLILAAAWFVLDMQESRYEDRYDRLEQRLNERIDEQNKRINELERDKLFREAYEHGKADASKHDVGPTSED